MYSVCIRYTIPKHNREYVYGNTGKTRNVFNVNSNYFNIAATISLFGSAIYQLGITTIITSSRDEVMLNLQPPDFRLGVE